MKKRVNILAAALLGLICTFMLAACGLSFKDDDKNWNAWTITVAATCEAEGVKTRVSKNDSTLIETRPIAALGHTWDEGVITTEPTCLGEGVKTKVCKDCGNHDLHPVIALGHKWGDWVISTEPTCTVSGVETRICERDDRHTDMRSVPETGHDWSDWVSTTTPSCSTLGIDTRICKNDNIHKETRFVSKLGHDWSTWVVTTEPTYAATGVETRICRSDSFHKETRSIPKLDIQTATKFTVVFDYCYNGNGFGHPAIIEEPFYTVDNLSVRLDVAIGNKAIKPIQPRKTGYAFAGWFRERDAINEWDFEKDTVTENLILYAKWADMAKVSVGENGSIILHENVDWHFSPQIVGSVPSNHDGFYFEAIPNEGYYFEKWVFLNKDGTENKPQYLYDGDYSAERTNFYSRSSVYHRAQYYGIYEIRAVFTNDETKLVNTTQPQINIFKNGNADATVFWYAPKKVKGTTLVARVIASENTVITEVSHTMIYESGGGNIILNHIYPETTWYAWYDIHLTTSTFGTADWVNIFIAEKK